MTHFISNSVVLAFGLGNTEFMIIGLIAVLLFGNRLPSVARSMGKSFIEFKKGVRGIEEDVADVTDAAQVSQKDTSASPSAPRFEPPNEPPR